MKRAALTVCLLALGLGSGAAHAGEASIPEGTITGRVIDITCFGPCAPGTDPRPFPGPADVVVSYPSSGQQVGRVPMGKHGRYTALAPPGRWEIRAVPLPEQNSNCWRGYPRRVRVGAGEVKHRRLLVENVCVQ